MELPASSMNTPNIATPSLLYIIRIVMLLLLSTTSGGGAQLALHESPGTGHCFSSPIVLPESGSSPPADWLELEHTQSLATETPNGSKPLTTHPPCYPRIATNQSQTIITIDIIQCGQHRVCVAVPCRPRSKE